MFTKINYTEFLFCIGFLSHGKGLEHLYSFLSLPPAYKLNTFFAVLKLR